MRVVRSSSVWETAPMGAPAGSPPFLNMVVAGFTSLAPWSFLEALLAIEKRCGRVRSVRNAPRIIDLDLILHGAHLARSRRLTLPHPRYREREFVLAPLRELGLDWCDPATGQRISGILGQGEVRILRDGALNAFRSRRSAPSAPAP